MASDGGDSDDSGFDDGLSSDEMLLGRIAQMRNMMNLASAAAPSPAASNSRQEPQSKPTRGVTPTTETQASTTLKPQQDAEKASNGQVDGSVAVATDLRGLSLRDAAANDPVEKTASPPPAYDHQHEEDNEEAQELRDEEEEEDEEDDGYTVTWSRGQLGLLFKANARGEAVIRRVNRKSSSAEGLHFARVGDVLMALNGESMRGRPFQQITDVLRLPDFPLTLSFKPARFDDEDDDGGDNGNGNAAADSQGPGLQVVRASDAQESNRQSMERKPSSSSIESSSNSANLPLSSTAQRLHQLAHGYGPTVHSPRSSFGDVPPPDEYDVVWSQGSLGCGLKQKNGLPTIKSVTPGAAVDPSVQQIAPGDVMVLINGMITEQIGFRAVVETMQRAAKPIYMRFRRTGGSVGGGSGGEPAASVLPRGMGQPPLSRHSSREFEELRESRVFAKDQLVGPIGPHQYKILWNEGPLGVQIKPRPTDGAVVISKLTGTGNPVLLADLEVGDVFVRIAGAEVAHLGISGTYEMLKTVQKPVVLVFERGFVSQPPAITEEPTAPSPRRNGFPVEDPRDSSVPSFRMLREQQAVSSGQSEHIRESFGGFSPQQRGEAVFGAAGRRAAHAKLRPSSFDTFGAIDERRSDLGASPGRYSHTHGNPSDRDSRYADPAYECSPPYPDDGDTTDDGAGDSYAHDEPPPLPRFSDIEMGRVQTSTVMSLPPPPAYLDVFSQSGRVVDQKTKGTPPRGSASPQSDKRRGSSQSPGQGRGQPPPEYPFTPSPQKRGQSSSPSPPLPQYSQPPPTYGEQNDDHMDRLRAQYIYAERKRNTQPPAGGRESALTQFSSYSDIDDSGAMGGYGRPSYGARPPPPVYPPPAGGRMSIQPEDLPPPQLWIQWSEGPLGITFRRSNGQIVVSRLTGAGYSQGLEQLRPGDWLVSFGNGNVGSYATKDLRLAETMELIKTLPKPLDMCFIVR